MRSGVAGRRAPARHLGVIEQVTTDVDGKFEIDVLVGAKCTVGSRHDLAATEVELGAAGAGGTDHGAAADLALREWLRRRCQRCGRARRADRGSW